MTREEIASKSHDIQASLGNKTVPEFESLPQIGMMVNLALHIRGLPVIEYDKFRMSAHHFFNILPSNFKQIILHLAEIEFVKLDTEGNTIKNVIPDVPFFQNIYNTVGEYAQTALKLNEPEELALEILLRLSTSPVERSGIFQNGAEKKVIERNLQIGTFGGYIIPKKARGKDILLSPLFFSENADTFADLTAKAGAKNVQKVLDLLKKAQGWPLSIIERDMKIGKEPITLDDLNLLKKLAQDGAVKPPSIKTDHAGSNYFFFTPAPGISKLNPSNKEIYERAMAILASVRQGQFLARQFAIWSPFKLLSALKRNGSIGATSETFAQYRQLAVMKVGTLKQSPFYPDRYSFVLNAVDENKKALDLAIELLNEGSISGMEINEDAKLALMKDQTYIDSLVSAQQLRETQTLQLNEETKEELDNLFLKGLTK